MCDSYKQEAAVNEQLTSVQGLSGLLRAVAGRVQGDVDGLNMELLLQSAEQLDKLEVVADYAMRVIDNVATGGDGASRSLVSRTQLVDLSEALILAGKNVRKLRV